jgi:hypothetical protein
MVSRADVNQHEKDLRQKVKVISVRLGSRFSGMSARVDMKQGYALVFNGDQVQVFKANEDLEEPMSYDYCQDLAGEPLIRVEEAIPLIPLLVTDLEGQCKQQARSLTKLGKEADEILQSLPTKDP